MSPNVPGCLRRLGQVIGHCVAMPPAPNVLEQNRTKGEARLRFFAARAVLAAKHIPSCYMPYPIAIYF